MTSVSKNEYIDKLDDIVNKYNNTSHIKIKMKPNDVESNSQINSSKEIVIKFLMIKALHLKLVIWPENQDIKIFLQNAMFQIGLKKFLRLKKVKSIVQRTFLQKTNQDEFRVEKVMKKVIKYILNGKAEIFFNGLIAKKYIV